MRKIIMYFFLFIDYICRLIFLPIDYITLNIIWLFYLDLLSDKYNYKDFTLLAWKKFKERQFIFIED